MNSSVLSMGLHKVVMTMGFIKVVMTMGFIKVVLTLGLLKDYDIRLVSILDYFMILKDWKTHRSENVEHKQKPGVGVHTVQCTRVPM